MYLLGSSARMFVNVSCHFALLTTYQPSHILSISKRHDILSRIEITDFCCACGFLLWYDFKIYNNLCRLTNNWWDSRWRKTPLHFWWEQLQKRCVMILIITQPEYKKNYISIKNSLELRKVQRRNKSLSAIWSWSILEWISWTHSSGSSSTENYSLSLN